MVKRKYEDLQNHRSAHEDLFDLIKTLPEKDALDLFHRVRAGGNAQAIVNNVKAGNLLLQLHLIPETRLRYELPYSRDMPASLATSGSPYLDSFIYEAASLRSPLLRSGEGTATEPRPSEVQSQYVKPYHAAVFVDPRLDYAKPSEWTTVSKDDSLMRDLLAAYFTHEYHLWPVF